MSWLDEQVEGLPLNNPELLRALATVLSDDMLKWLIRRAEAEQSLYESELQRRQQA